MSISHLTPHYQVHIPADIRQFLGLSQGDALSFVIRNNTVQLRKADLEDADYTELLDQTMKEWHSDHDDDLLPPHRTI